MKISRKLCKILTLGRHWWAFYPGEKAYVRCRLCGKLSDSMWGEYARWMARDVGYVNRRRKKFGLALFREVNE